MNDEIQVTVIAAGFDEENVTPEAFSAGPRKTLSNNEAKSESAPTASTRQADEIDIPPFLRPKN